MSAVLYTDARKLRHNAETLVKACHAHGIRLSAVTKVFCAEESIVRVLEEAGVDSFADSRLLNLQKINSRLDKMLLRILDPMEAEDAVRLADISLQSEAAAIDALALAAEKHRKKHRVVLMIDLGDLREGCFFKDRAGILALAERVHRAPWLDLYGVGTNLTCFGGILPDETNLTVLTDIAESLRKALHIPLPLVSGGNSSSIGLMLRGGIPKGVNHLRIGEGLLLGRDTALGTPLEGLYQDVFTLSVPVGEVKTKPSKPVGTSGLNAFGEPVTFKDKGDMRRAIGLAGRQDIDAEGLTPTESGIEVIGASSDHLLMDVSARPDISVGSRVEFTLDYGALLKACTSPYIKKQMK